MTTTHSAADILLAHLIALGLASDPEENEEWPGYFGMESDDGNHALSVMDTTPVADGRLMDGSVVDHPGVQIRIRSVEGYRHGNAKAKAVKDAVDQIVRASVSLEGSNYLIQNVSRRPGPLYLGLDGRNRHIFTINAVLTINNL